MRTPPPALAAPRDRLSWLWLLLGAALLPFVTIQTELPLAAWLAPALLIRFSRAQRAIVGLPIVTVVCIGALTLASRDLAPGPLLAMIGLLFGLIYALPYIVDRLLAPHLGGLARTLAYPAAVTALGFAVAVASPFGTSATAAYGQYGLLPLVQLVSLTGIWGLIFLVAWFGPVANALWERASDATAARRAAAVFAGVLLAALLFGSLRLAFFPVQGPTVRVAALAPDEESPFAFSLLALAGATEAERAAARAQTARRQDELFDRTIREARAGARLVAWSEVALIVPREDEAALFARAATVARREGIYLQLGLVTVPRTDRFPYAENRAVLFDPAGRILWDYAKTEHPMDDSEIFAPGPGRVATAATPLGNLATVICYDMDFPALLRQVGRADTGLLLAPSSDWAPVKYSHAQWATFRAIENGVTLVRPTRQGLQIAVDHQGRVLGSADSLATNRSTLVVDVPTTGVWTLYRTIGDAFGLASVVLLVGLLALPLARRRAVAAGAGVPALAPR